MTQRRGQLHRLSRRVPRPRPGLSLAASSRRSCRCSSLVLRGYVRPAAPLGRSAARCTRSASSPAGARYAGHPGRRGASALVYLLSGLVASLAAIIYVAHLGQAKSDAGHRLRADAITAVVLGGTSVFGGRGTLWRHAARAVRARRAAERPAAWRRCRRSWPGVLTGVLLLATIAIDRIGAARAARPPRRIADRRSST